MLKKLLVIISMVWYTTAFAQPATNAAAGRFIKVPATDSIVTIKTSVKNQLIKLLRDKKQPALRLIVTGADSNNNNNIGRWLAAKQQLNLYCIDVSAIVSKYIGETEKNLEMVFTKAEANNCILLFDEADALFGQRTAVSEKDNSALVNYFLQRLTKFKNTAILHCKYNDCFDQLAKQKFITVTGIQ
jgi:SpoVK/Ycf46/Vps4 family AAA+-type ATPase